MKVLLLGYYGYKNIGDDLFIENLLRYLSPISNKIRVICKDDYYESRFADNKKVKFLCADRLSKLSRLFAVGSSDFIVWGGGTLQIDEEPRSLIVIQRISQILNKRFGFLGIGLEGSNLDNVTLGSSVENLFLKSSFLYLRDRNSYDFAIRKFHKSSNVISLGGDLAFLCLDLYEPFIKKNRSSEIKNLSFTGKHWWGEGRAKFYSHILLKLIEKYGTQIHLLPGRALIIVSAKGSFKRHLKDRVWTPMAGCERDEAAGGELVEASRREV